MANNVHSYIEFVKINDAAKAKLQELFGRCREMDYGRRWFADMFVEGDLTYDDVEQYSWTTEHIGPKWCYIEDSDVEGETPYFVTDSAWAQPETGLVKLLEVLEPLDNNLVTTISYEDEMPNFIGWSVYTGSEMYDGREDDSEEIQEFMFDKNPNLKEHWDEDNDDWMTDEETGDYTEDAERASEEYQELLYEFISDMNSEGIADTLKQLEEEE